MIILKKYRKLKGLTQERLANLVGMSKTSVVLWESDKREPQNKELIKMAEIFNVPVDVLLDVIPTFSNTETYETSTDQIYRPILGTVKAGYDMYCDQNILGYKAVEKQKAKGQKPFGYVLQGTV